MKAKKLQSSLKKRKKKEDFVHLKMKKDLLHRTLKTLTQKVETEKSDYIKNKNIFLVTVPH